MRTTNEPSPLRASDDGAATPPTVRVDVVDTGIGIERDAAARIFDAFEQESRTITRRFGGLGLGLARASLRAGRAALDNRPSVLSGEIDALDADIAAYRQTLCAGLDDGSLRERPRDLLTLRLRMVDIAAAAVALELQALGGRALLREASGGHARRAREAAFLAVVTPTVAQLKSDLARTA